MKKLINVREVTIKSEHGHETTKRIEGGSFARVNVFYTESRYDEKVDELEKLWKRFEELESELLVFTEKQKAEELEVKMREELTAWSITCAGATSQVRGHRIGMGGGRTLVVDLHDGMVMGSFTASDVTSVIRV